METSNKPFRADVVVKKTEYRTGMKGNIFLLVHLNANKELIKNNINALIFNDLDKRKVFIKGSKVRLAFDKDFVPEIKTVLKNPNPFSELPETCTSCGTSLKSIGKNLYCPNHFCSATSRGFLYKMISLAAYHNDKPCSNEFISLFLDKYVYNDTTNAVDNPKSFKIMFSSITEKNTQSRENQWLKHHLTHGKSLWNLDVDLQGFLRSPKLSAKDFWDICNFPKITDEQQSSLSKIDPQAFINGSISKQDFLSLDNHVKNLLRDNLDFVSFLVTFFEDFGEKQWVVSKK